MKSEVYVRRYNDSLGRFVNDCFEDLPQTTQYEHLSKQDRSVVERLCVILAEQLRHSHNRQIVLEEEVRQLKLVMENAGWRHV